MKTLRMINKNHKNKFQENKRTPKNMEMSQQSIKEILNTIN